MGITGASSYQKKSKKSFPLTGGQALGDGADERELATMNFVLIVADVWVCDLFGM